MPRTYNKPEPPKRTRLRETIGKALAKRRAELGLSLLDAAAVAGCSSAWLCQLETAKANIYRSQVDSLECLTRAYKFTMDDLVKLLRIQ